MGKNFVSEKKNPFTKFVVDEGWEVIEIESGVKQIKIEIEEEEKEDGSSNHNRNISK